MRLKIRCDGESEKIYKIFWELNKSKNFLATHAIVEVPLEPNHEILASIG
jgi:hypothetical protein